MIFETRQFAGFFVVFAPAAPRDICCDHCEVGLFHPVGVAIIDPFLFNFMSGMPTVTNEDVFARMIRCLACGSTTLQTAHTLLHSIVVAAKNDSAKFPNTASPGSALFAINHDLCAL